MSEADVQGVAPTVANVIGNHTGNPSVDEAWPDLPLTGPGKKLLYLGSQKLLLASTTRYWGLHDTLD